MKQDTSKIAKKRLLKKDRGQEGGRSSLIAVEDRREAAREMLGSCWGGQCSV